MKRKETSPNTGSLALAAHLFDDIKDVMWSEDTEVIKTATTPILTDDEKPVAQHFLREVDKIAFYEQNVKNAEAQLDMAQAHIEAYYADLTGDCEQLESTESELEQAQAVAQSLRDQANLAASRAKKARLQAQAQRISAEQAEKAAELAEQLAEQQLAEAQEATKKANQTQLAAQALRQKRSRLETEMALAQAHKKLQETRLEAAKKGLSTQEFNAEADLLNVEIADINTVRLQHQQRLRQAREAAKVVSSTDKPSKVEIYWLLPCFKCSATAVIKKRPTVKITAGRLGHKALTR